LIAKKSIMWAIVSSGVVVEKLISEKIHTFLAGSVFFLPHPFVEMGERGVF